ncbi:bifunctional phosphatidyl-N-methylethanolamine N-methyltransferase/phosphatidyl-N-dimethylethanolamine N-methyltransferase [Rhodotorula paludigena]|uniref:bifunctional phosphatidyl-N-methylethanolamine N-methyltransferase/phosphatidyl-N-dimethylethanolamine N-methyltransferase n=1 Tax=Rhodotorula paludigena TaxID=86838 RepID=UPI00316E30B0
MLNVLKSIDWSQPSLWVAIASICFNPLYWNIVARQEYKNKILTKLAGGNRYLACYALGLSIFVLGIVRDHLYQKALADQPTEPILRYTEFKFLAAGLFAVGSTLVGTSMWALGVTGTYLGDYCGILMDHKVESFPFNVTDSPMYTGSTMCFLATALWYQSPAGLVLTALVYVVYQVALSYEDPFTGAIYAKRDEERKNKVANAEPSGSSSAVRSRAAAKEL